MHTDVRKAILGMGFSHHHCTAVRSHEHQKLLRTSVVPKVDNMGTVTNT